MIAVIAAELDHTAATIPIVSKPPWSLSDTLRNWSVTIERTSGGAKGRNNRIVSSTSVAKGKQLATARATSRAGNSAKTNKNTSCSVRTRQLSRKNIRHSDRRRRAGDDRLHCPHCSKYFLRLE